MYNLCLAFLKHGTNLMAILQFSSRIHPSRIAVKDSKNEYTYLQLYRESFSLAINLQNTFSVNKSSKVALFCKNHCICVKTLFACSRLGADTTFLNIEMSQPQIKRVVQQNNFDFLVCDNDFLEKVSDARVNCTIIPCFGRNSGSLENLIRGGFSNKNRIKRQRSGRINVLTGGTGGQIKIVRRSPSIISLVKPFLALLTNLDLNKYKSVYIAVPLYHGYGLASLVTSFVLSAKIFLLEKFTTKYSLELVVENNIEIAILVPTMLKRMLRQSPEAMKRLKRILSGGAALDETLSSQVIRELGPVLFNLYGTSEAGFSVLATPADLQIHPDTIGKIISGVSLKILDESGKKVKSDQVGVIHIKTSWSMDIMKNRYISTGDMAYANKEGYIFLKGRNDDMIVSGGENVYPKDVERVLLKNESIDEVAVIGIKDESFGERLLAFIVFKPKSIMREGAEIEHWLSSRVARYQMPAQFRIIDSLPTTDTGKISKTALMKMI
ncbi:MAG: AMP-binding protein [Bacteroidota bacterium]